MFTPSDTYSSETLLDVYGRYLGARLKADPSVADVQSGFEKAQDALSRANDRQRSARRGLQDALAARDYAAFLLSRVLAHFRLAVLGHVDFARAGPLFARYFPEGERRFTLLPLPRRIERIKILEADLVTAPDAAGLRSWGLKFAEQRENLERAIAEWQQARVVHTEAQGAEVTERSYWRNAYRTAFADLVKLFPADRRKVETFFRPGPARRRDAEGVEASPAVLATPAAPAA